MPIRGCFGNRRAEKLQCGDASGGGFQRLGPNAGGGAERSLGGCWSSDVMVVRLVAGTALGVAAS